MELQQFYKHFIALFAACEVFRGVLECSTVFVERVVGQVGIKVLVGLGVGLGGKSHHSFLIYIYN